MLGDEPGAGISIDEAAITTGAASGDWLQVGGPHIRSSRAGLRLVDDGSGTECFGQSRSGHGGCTH